MHHMNTDVPRKSSLACTAATITAAATTAPPPASSSPSSQILRRLPLGRGARHHRDEAGSRIWRQSRLQRRSVPVQLTRRSCLRSSHIDWGSPTAPPGSSCPNSFVHKPQGIRGPVEVQGCGSQRGPDLTRHDTLEAARRFALHDCKTRQNRLIPANTCKEDSSRIKQPLSRRSRMTCADLSLGPNRPL